MLIALLTHPPDESATREFVVEARRPERGCSYDHPVLLSCAQRDANPDGQPVVACELPRWRYSRDGLQPRLHLDLLALVRGRDARGRVVTRCNPGKQRAPSQDQPQASSPDLSSYHDYGGPYVDHSVSALELSSSCCIACSRVEPPMASVVASEQQGASEDVLHEPIIYLGSPAQPRIELSGQLPSPQPAEQQQPQEPEQKEQYQSPQERKAAGDQRPHSHRTVPQGNNCVFFAKVPPFVQEEQLLELFTRCGAVVGINLYRSWATTKKSKVRGQWLLLWAAHAGLAHPAHEHA